MSVQMWCRKWQSPADKVLTVGVEVERLEEGFEDHEGKVVGCGQYRKGREDFFSLSERGLGGGGVVR